MHLQAAVDPVRPLRALHRLRPAAPHHPVRPGGAPLHDRYTVDDGVIGDDERSLLSDMTLHDQRVLRLGLQLVRVAAQGRRVAPDRLRQRLPRLAGDVAALPLPVAREAQPALVDLLRGDQAADAPDARLGAVLRRARGGPAAYREQLAAYAAIARAALRHRRGSRSSAPSTSPTSTRSRGSSSAPTSPRTPSARRSPPCSRRTRSRSSPSCSGPASSRGGPRTRRRRAPHEGADDLVLVTRRARRRARRGGATSASRSWCSRPPAATPRRSSASTSSTRSVRCSTPAG